MYGQSRLGGLGDLGSSSVVVDSRLDSRPADFEAVSAKVKAVDLGPVVKKFLKEGWTAERVAIAETRYRRFLIMAALYDGVELTPALDVDLFWHEHILNTRSYIRDCETLFGRYLHHTPEFGEDAPETLAKERADAVTSRLYEALFQAPYLASEVAGCVIHTCVKAPTPTVSAGCVIHTCVKAPTTVVSAGCVIHTCVKRDLASPGTSSPTAVN